MTSYSVYKNMKRINNIYFDMDGTIVDFYRVDNWLGKLTAEDFSPYETAKPLIDTIEFTKLINQLQQQGHKIGIITWGSKYSSEKFLEKVKRAKKEWLMNHLPDIKFDEFYIIDYSCNKASVALDPFGILFDDDDSVRKSWPGKAYSPEHIFTVLNNILKEGENFERI